MTLFNQNDPHRGWPILTAGAALETAKVVMILLHGRGASAEDILTLAREFDRPAVAYLAPQAAGYAWYPNRFTAPIASNEPSLSSALKRVSDVLGQVEAAGISPENTILLGFSQGACLATDFAARNPRRYGGVVGLSGGLIGPLGEPLHYPKMDGNPLNSTPVFLGCSDIDFHIPKERVQETADVLSAMGADVTMRLYPGMDHTVNQDEIDFVRGMIDSLA